MSELSLAVVVVFIGLVWMNRVMNHIPKTGRDGTASGEIIRATITNTNKYADTTATMRAEKDGRKFKVKIKATEVRLWIKGDEVDIRLSQDKKTYRVLFNDYFRKNEDRIKERTLERLGKITDKQIASLLTGYKKDFYDKFETAELGSREIFSFVTGMRMIDIYSVVTALLVVLCVWWYSAFSPGVTSLFLPAVLILGVFWSLYCAITSCKRIIRKAVVRDKQL